MAARSGLVVLVTAGSRPEAERLAAALIEARLAACVNLVAPLTSIYRWQGKVARDREILLIIKTRRPLLARLTRTVQRLHSYDVPEVVALPIAGGSAAYLAWLAREADGARPAGRRSARARR